MFWKSSLFALVACVGLVSAQISVPYTDPENGIVYQQWTTDVNGGYSFSIALPMNPTDEFIGKIVGPVEGWSGVSLRGAMTNSLLLAAWPYEGEIVHSFRMIDTYIDPLVYGGAQATTMYSSVNSTHFSYTFRCQNCIKWGDFGFDAAGDFTVFGWAISTGDIADPSDPDGVIPPHDTFMGQYGMLLVGAKSPNYQSWIDDAPTPTAEPTTPTITPTPTVTTIPSSTQVLGEADYIIVGGGAGGLVAADRLSETGASVILIERGPPATYAHGGKIIPPWLVGKGLTRFDVPGLCNEIWVDSKGVACEDVDRMAGCVLGGGTAVNAGMFFVPPDSDWNYNFPTGWKASDVAPATQRMFQRIPPNDTPSRDGKRHVQETYDILGAAVKQAGWREIAINQQPNQKNHTYGHSPFMFSNGERGGPLATYLVSAKRRPNFQLQMNTMVRRVRRNGGTVTGVEVYASSSEGKTGIYKLKAGGKVILSAGAFGTAKILFRSGIGPKDQLDIVKASELDGATMIAQSSWILSPVGYNVVDHTNTDLVISHPNIKAYDFYEAYLNPIPADRDAYLNSRSGTLTTAAPGIPLVMYDQIVGTDGITRQIQWTARAEGSLGEQGTTLITISQYLGTGVTSRGRITIRSNLGMTVGVEPYATTAADKAAIIKGVDNMLSAIKGWNGVNGARITLLQPLPDQSATDYVNAYVQGRGSNHWLGSARLGTDDGTKLGGTRGSVVDLSTKVYGTTNLFVVDASIFPGHVSTNPSAPILIAAEHAVKKILALGVAKRYEQCGGIGFIGPSTCESPYRCLKQNDYYWQCL